MFPSILGGSIIIPKPVWDDVDAGQTPFNNALGAISVPAGFAPNDNAELVFERFDSVLLSWIEVSTRVAFNLNTGLALAEQEIDTDYGPVRNSLYRARVYHIASDTYGEYSATNLEGDTYEHWITPNLPEDPVSSTYVLGSSGGFHTFEFTTFWGPGFVEGNYFNEGIIFFVTTNVDTYGPYFAAGWPTGSEIGWIAAEVVTDIPDSETVLIVEIQTVVLHSELYPQGLTSLNIINATEAP